MALFHPRSDLWSDHFVIGGGQVVSRVEVHGVEEELAKLREPLADLKATYVVLPYGFRR